MIDPRIASVRIISTTILSEKGFTPFSNAMHLDPSQAYNFPCLRCEPRTPTAYFLSPPFTKLYLSSIPLTSTDLGFSDSCNDAGSPSRSSRVVPVVDPI